MPAPTQGQTSPFEDHTLVQAFEGHGTLDRRAESNRNVYWVARGGLEGTLRVEGTSEHRLAAVQHVGPSRPTRGSWTVGRRPGSGSPLRVVEPEVGDEEWAAIARGAFPQVSVAADGQP